MRIALHAEEDVRIRDPRACTSPRLPNSFGTIRKPTGKTHWGNADRHYESPAHRHLPTNTGARRTRGVSGTHRPARYSPARTGWRWRRACATYDAVDGEHAHAVKAVFGPADSGLGYHATTRTWMQTGKGWGAFDAEDAPQSLVREVARIYRDNHPLGWRKGRKENEDAPILECNTFSGSPSQSSSTRSSSSCSGTDTAPIFPSCIPMTRTLPSSSASSSIAVVFELEVPKTLEQFILGTDLGLGSIQVSEHPWCARFDSGTGGKRGGKKCGSFLDQEYVQLQNAGGVPVRDLLLGQI
ncbi:hypothetical protein B0H11DRAFT_2206981 [Mycena galericulata]|nr:hypothetical protein B0H11DRAFT_2206981 [Mycena galericulata]